MSGLMYEIESKELLVNDIKLTPESVTDLLIQHALMNASEKRDFVVITGAAGHALITRAVERESYYTLLEDNKDKFSAEDHTRLIDMIKSSDSENFELAKIIIKNKL